MVDINTVPVRGDGAFGGRGTRRITKLRSIRVDLGRNRLIIAFTVVAFQASFGSEPYSAHTGESMKSSRPGFLVLVWITVATLNAAATISPCLIVSGTSISVCTPPTNAISTVTCPGSSNFCGLSYKPTGWSNLSTTATPDGFHDYTPGTYDPTDPGHDSQQWLNAKFSSLNVTFNLCNTSNPPSCYGQLAQGTVTVSTGGSADKWRAPTDPTYGDDKGYYLATTSTTNSITLQFGTVTTGSNGKPLCTNCINYFALYWGSVDSWNTIEFKDANNHVVDITGSQAFPTAILGQNDTASFMTYFSVFSGYMWQSVTIKSSNPAFEFDNVSWHPTTATCIGTSCTFIPPGGSPSVPTPEPSGVSLVAGAGVAIAASLRRKIRR